jgi:glycerol-3-phosphate acyltransferase PlsY
VPGALAGVILVALAFFAGAIPWGYLAGRISRDIDLRTVGSGGTGATNVLRTLGGQAAAIVLVLDVLKGLLPVLLAKQLGFEPAWVAAAAVATVAGHCWSPFIGFRGGKGVATGAGAAVALLPQVLLALPAMVVVVWTTRFVSLGSLTAAGLAAIVAISFGATGRLAWPSALAILAIAAIIVARHEENVRRLLAGTERRLGETVQV